MKYAVLTVPNGKMSELTTWCLGNDMKIVSTWGSTGFSLDEKTSVYLIFADADEQKLKDSEWYKKFSKN